MTLPVIDTIVTVTLNPTIDRIIEVPGLHIGGHLPGRLSFAAAGGQGDQRVPRVVDAGRREHRGRVGGSDAVDLFERGLRHTRVTPRFTPIDGATRENITLIDPAGPSETHVRDAGPDVTDGEIDRLSTELEAMAGPGVLFVFTGSLAPGLAPERFASLLDVCTAHEARVAVDSSGPALRAAAERDPWLIKPNLIELADLAGYDVQEDNAILEAGLALNRRIPIVLITMRERGACCFGESRAVRGRLALPPTQLRSTVGCGDAFLAGFLAAVSRDDWALDTALRQALAAAAASAMHEQPAAFKADDLPPLAERAEIKPVA